jgi:hypothetical protein
VKGSESFPSRGGRLTSTALRGTKKLQVGISDGRAAIALSDFEDQPGFLAEQGLASSEEFVLFRLRCSRNSPSSGAAGAADEAIDLPSDRNRWKFTASPIYGVVYKR